MQIAKVVQSVYDRLSGDTGAGGLFATGANLVKGVYAYRLGKQVTQGESYIVFTPTSAVATDDMTNNVVDFTMGVAVYVDPQAVSGVGLSAIIDRVYVRLHDWTPTLDGWSACGPWRFTDAGSPELPDEDSLQWILNFELLQSQARA